MLVQINIINLHCANLFKYIKNYLTHIHLCLQEKLITTKNFDRRR